MEKTKLTRDDLRQMAIGETAEFKLPSAAACESARVQCYQMQHLEGCEYTVSTDYANCVVKVTKLERP